ncbi:MAG: tRNA pseudouridine(13) synthase TruD [Moraxellaceae bacterium]|jgi:tRNA pseudouridine13 synthase|nr:tRNA pseudouridine(13) synthase TruD [Moraxellaceae bacterium]
MDWSPYLLDALPFAHGGPLEQATLRAVPEDFRVEEWLGFEPSGEGEHLFLLIRKRNQNTAWVAAQLARVAGVREDAVSYAGLKDRRAVTVQWFSMHLPTRQLPDLAAVWNDDIELLAQTWNARKLRRGAHQGNRFTIMLRDFAGERAAVEARLVRMAQLGVPNYIGPQRFGIDNANLLAGEALLRGPVRRRLNHREGLALSAVRSALFNRVLGERIGEGSWNECRAGDVLMLDGRGSFFRPEPGDALIASRLAALEVHPTGPLYGRGGSAVGDDVQVLEQAVAAGADGLVEALERAGVEAQRRALRLRVTGFEWTWPADDALELRFGLAAGAFATSVLRELAILRGSDAGSLPVE